MAKNKFYAALFPDGKEVIYDSWINCSADVKGKGHVIYKGFKELVDAELFLKNSRNSRIEKNDSDADVYIDGSFFKDCSPYAGYGCVVVKDNRVVTTFYGKTLLPAVSRNIDGELAGALAAARWAKKNNFKITIVYDYTGIENWANSAWKAEKPVSKEYAMEIKKYLDIISFRKVKGHSGDKWNDLADELAKKGALE